MIVSLKDIYKMTGIIIVCFCAVLVCTMFLNYDLDLSAMGKYITADASKVMYDAQRSTAKVISGLSGGCLLMTTAVLLCFYIGHYVDTHKKQLGIMKALGYSGGSVARRFWVFGIPVLAGTSLGYAGAHLLMPLLYKIQNKDGYLPDISVSFHPGLCAVLVVLPTLFFALLAVGFSFLKLRIPALWLIREQSGQKVVPAKKDTDMSFLHELQKSNVRQRKSLVFFITFAVFCFSSMTQMSFSMDELASRMMAVMIMAIGMVLAVVILLIATTSIVKANRKTITMMKVFGYSAKECAGAVLNGYRPWAYMGFVIGTVYQYALLKIMVVVVFKDMEGMPDYGFDVPALLIAFAAFFVLYEIMMHTYTRKMERLSVKEIMLD